MEPWRPSPRNPMDWIDPNTFRFQFANLRYAYEWKLCYLCFQVDREDFSYDDSNWGIFRNKVHPRVPCHAELCFLSWFRDQYPSRDEHYHVTWFLSWSPCPTCAEKVVRFLEEYKNLKLSIFTARLYYFWHEDFQEGLRNLRDIGVQLDIMRCDDFEYCWDTFVDHNGMRFQRWNMLKDYDLLVTELDEILRTTMTLLKADIFYHHFGNQSRVPKPFKRRKTYLCYQLKQLEGPTSVKGCLQNKENCHAEMCFINKIQSLQLDPSQRFEITCYITWSPCPTCARNLVEFVRHHTYLSLRIFASRLYFHWRRKHVLGLRHLQSEVPVAVMGRPEFEDCWRKFVDHQDRPFQPWNNLDQNTIKIKRRLRKILMPQNDLVNDFRNLQLE
ncbi:DNA dC-_dU-editing enzyme APOBEC-3D-like isoform X3 [Hyaena hyaena]|uniref:DNA dC->dU-editing enzyme APOBEC-3D-like isoform X1 n=1 Tax=Hyaena hyaena TaxID=95912 RepID=UPI001922161A|nr:DNA dC->dU-editing enzyme APOBEC-3D-like isoform X1 [Hyaena hyaena]XP_039092386.1 DNA dC->dU-editing enzyme APOBEC-3D-like isoform X3 [Hyaena hyaena]